MAFGVGLVRGESKRQFLEVIVLVGFLLCLCFGSVDSDDGKFELNVSFPCFFFGFWTWLWLLYSFFLTFNEVHNSSN